MQVYVKIKKIGKRRNVLEPVPYVIPDSVHSLRQLITTIVESEVEQYNQKGTDVQLILYLTSEEIDAQADAGKVSELFAKALLERTYFLDGWIFCLWCRKCIRRDAEKIYRKSRLRKVVTADVKGI